MSLSRFHPALQRWFSERIGVPTTAQSRGWDSIRQAEEIVMAETLTPPGPDELRPTSSASGTEMQSGLSLVNETLSTLDSTWTETPASTP